MKDDASSPNVKDAFRALFEAMRAGAPKDAEALPDGGFDSTFLDRTAPALEFLW